MNGNPNTPKIVIMNGNPTNDEIVSEEKNPELIINNVYYIPNYIIDYNYNYIYLKL